MYNYSMPYLINGINKTNLKSFKIYGLFGRYDIALKFDKEVNIYIGENGLGKTTILNCLYYILNNEFSKLNSVNFKSIEVSFRNDEKIYTLNKTDICVTNYNLDKYTSNFYNFLNYNISTKNFSNVLDEIYDPKLRKLIKQYAYKNGISESKALDQVLNIHYDKSKSSKTKIKELKSAIDKYINERIIYLPTYRRIENEFNDFIERRSDFDDSELLIRFGMSDVQKSIDSILEKIRDIAIDGFNKMTGNLLEQYTKGDRNLNRIRSVEKETVKIVLDRLGDEINVETKNGILNLIKSNRINDDNHLYLLNFLNKLNDNYVKQKQFDDKINKFVSTCNKYFNDKEFIYNPSDLTIKIYMKDGKNTVALTDLSSGEKQIVSLFSKLYIESDKKSIVIIDEPELSLSIRWQQMLLPDIMRSENCNFLITVTHSPFVFENEFDMDAKEIRTYMSRI